MIKTYQKCYFCIGFLEEIDYLMKTNPFTSSTFENIWSNHFNNGKEPISLSFISGVKFVNNSRLSVYENVGKNLTKGIYYELDYSKDDYKGKTFLIYDVPSYYKMDAFLPPTNCTLKLKTIYQYDGFLMDISKYSNQEDYINAQFSSKNRREFRSNQRRLEQCFDITYEFIHGDVKQDEFDVLFQQFHDLLSKRFEDKQTNYHHLSPDKWSYYNELVIKMIIEKKASLLVIYNDLTPIAITLNFHAEDILYEAITVFDPDYYKFSLGKTSIIKLLEWCFENNYRISDFSKGDFDYKHKWGNLKYDFNYHILYDSSSIKSRLKANYIALFYKTKLYLRKRNYNEVYRKFMFKIKGGSQDNIDLFKNVKFEKLDNFKVNDTLNSIDYTQKEYSNFLPQCVYTFLFANPEANKKIKVYQHQSNKKQFVITGSKKAQQITFG